jgi:hypothetical protein
MKNPNYPYVLVCLILVFNLQFVTAQNVAINTTGNNPDASSILDISATNKGILIPRVNLLSVTDASSIVTPAISLLIFNTNESLTGGVGFYYNSGNSISPRWVKLSVLDTGGVVKSATSGSDTIALDRFPMGEVYMTGNTTATTVSIAGTYYKVSGTTSFSSGSYNFSNGGVSNRLTYTGAREKMFHIACTLSASSSTSNQVIKAALFKNGVALGNGVIQTKLGSTGDITSTAIHVMTELMQNDYLELFIMNTSGTGPLTITEMNLFAMGVSMGRD